MTQSTLRKRVDTRPVWKRIWEDYGGIVWMIPVLAGVLLFTIWPMITSLQYAFHEYDPYAFDQSEQLLGFTFENFTRIFTTDRGMVFGSLYRTFRYAVLSVVIGLVGSYILALILNQKTKGIKIFRVVYYIPILLPAVASTLLWKDITRVEGGYLNLILEAIGLRPYTFYTETKTVLPTLLFMSLFSLGGNAIMWLSQMKNVPAELYESADLDGANYFHKLFYVTIPMTTSMLFYLLIMSSIGGLQAFGNVYALRGTGIANEEIEFIVVKIYLQAFVFNDMSYACALSWFLFVVIGILTAFVFKTSKWVYYGEDA